MLSYKRIMVGDDIVGRRKKTKDNNKKTIILSSIIVVCCVVIISLCIFILKNIKVYEQDVIINSNIENISVDNLLPVTEVFGKQINNNESNSYDFYEFEVLNVSSKERDYQVFVTKNSMGTNEINNDYVMFYLTDENNIPVGVFEKDTVLSYKKLNYIDDKPESKLLYTGKLDGHKIKKFKLRVWVADNYVSDSENYFSVDIGVRAI